MQTRFGTNPLFHLQQVVLTVFHWKNQLKSLKKWSFKYNAKALQQDLL
ncbi:hypothetical protein ACEQPO_30190 [Bacillus sp. SL00103]